MSKTKSLLLILEHLFSIQRFILSKVQRDCHMSIIACWLSLRCSALVLIFPKTSHPSPAILLEYVQNVPRMTIHVNIALL